MKILSAKQLREADNYTIKHEPISSANLMERAATACTEWITEHFNNHLKVFIFCGMGNNGGDGLVISRLLLQKKYDVTTCIIRHSDKTSKDFSVNLTRLKKIKSSNIVDIKTISQFPKELVDKGVHEYLIIDAILGSGLSKTVEGLIADTIQKINTQSTIRIAIDIPTGLVADACSVDYKNILKANFTLTFELPKLAFLFPENANFVGNFDILPIGLSAEYINNTDTQNTFVTIENISPLLNKRKKFSHKGTYGHALIIAGSLGKMGAAVLASKACIRSGVGLITAHVPTNSHFIMQTAIPEVMLSIDSSTEIFSEIHDISNYDAIGVGPGLGTNKHTTNALKLLIQNSQIPIVFDADAINIIAENKTWLSFIPKHSIFTPHQKEFERLVGKTSNETERLYLMKTFCFKYQCYLVLKGAHSTTCTPEGKYYFNSTGNPGMATAGSGDILTGIISGLLAQGYTSLASCILGVFIHGLAGDMALQIQSEQSLIASDIIDNLGKAFACCLNK